MKNLKIENPLMVETHNVLLFQAFCNDNQDDYAFIKYNKNENTMSVDTVFVGEYPESIVLDIIEESIVKSNEMAYIKTSPVVKDWLLEYLRYDSDDNAHERWKYTYELLVDEKE